MHRLNGNQENQVFLINAYRAFFKVINIKYKAFFEYLFMYNNFRFWLAFLFVQLCIISFVLSLSNLVMHYCHFFYYI